VTASCINHS